jgi:hypothetical protein
VTIIVRGIMSECPKGKGVAVKVLGIAEETCRSRQQERFALLRPPTV